MTSPYFPTLSTLSNAIGVDLPGLSDSARVTVSGGLLKLLVRLAVSSGPFDPEAYVSRNPDVKAAWEAGQIADLHLHYLERGYFEGRDATLEEFDADWYLANYKDVALAVSEHHVSSAEDHYAQAGKRESRAPNGAVAAAMGVWRSVLVA